MIYFMYILLDDERDIGMVSKMMPHINIDQNKFKFDLIIRSFDEFIEKSKDFPDPYIIFVDHDLGTDEFGKDGHFAMKHLFKLNKRPKQVFIVSANPIGKINIESVLINDFKMKKIAERVFS